MAISDASAVTCASSEGPYGDDPADNIGAVDLFAEAGLIHPGVDPSGPGRIA